MTDSEYRLVRRRTANVLLFAFLLVTVTLGFAIWAVNDARQTTESENTGLKATLACRSELAANADERQGDTLAALGQLISDAVQGTDPTASRDRFLEANTAMQEAQAARAEQSVRCPY